MNEKDLKPYGKDISKLVPVLLKDNSKIPNVILTQEKEFKILQDAKETIGKEFSSKVDIVKAEKTKEQKAKSALPSKPAILVQ